MGEVFPGGPIVPPTEFSLGTQIVSLDKSLSTPAIAHAIGYGQWHRIVPDGLTKRDRDIVRMRFGDKRDGLEQSHTDTAAIMLAIRLCGIETGIMGYRAAVKLCGTLIGAWPIVTGTLATNHIDPTTDALWKVCAVMYRLFVEPPEESRDDRIKRRQNFYTPIAGEPVGIIEGAGKQVRAVTVREASDSWRSAKRQYDALTQKLSGR